MYSTAVLAIANRLGATQALGDLVERVARVRRGRPNAGVLVMIIPQLPLSCGTPIVVTGESHEAFLEKRWKNICPSKQVGF
jgi:hypothetical protein